MEKGQVVQTNWPRELWVSTEEHTVVIKFNPSARAGRGDVAAVQASSSVGPLQWKGNRPGGPHEQPVDKTENLEMWT